MNKTNPLSILLIEDNPADAELITYELRHANVEHVAQCVATRSDFLQQLESGVPDAIISDFSMPQFNALDALEDLKNRRINVPFILVTGSQSEEVAVECLKQGADDYILKASLKRLPAALLACVQRKKVERDRAEAEERLREQAALLNKAQDAILVMDLSGAITFWNSSAERIYGWSSAEMIGKAAASSLSGSDSALENEAMAIALREDEWNGELQQRTCDGREIWVQSRWSLVRDGEDQPKSILVINSDITEKKKMEAHFLRSQRLESIGTLAGGIAHDLNNVLTPILVSLKLIRQLKGNVPSDVLETLETSAHRGASIVQQVLSFARGVEGERALLDPKHPLNEVLRMARDLFPRTVEVRSRLSPELWPVNGDPTQLYQVFMNLVVNARDSMPNGGTLTIEASNTEIDENYARMQPDAHTGGYVLINVSDTGSGIPQSIIPRIFEPFFTTKEPGKGTGLGLSTTLGIVRSHGGFLTVYSEEGKGTSFKVYLPAATSKTNAKKKGQTPTLPQGSGELVMVVDDEAAVREIIKVTLENNGYEVITANDGTEAVATLAPRPGEIRAAMIDLMMPYMDGLATIRAIRKMDPEVRLIAISGLMDTSRIAQLSEIGNVQFLAKPFTTEQLLGALSSVLVGSPAPAATA